jgi:SAM-dependent methyltransferase
MDVGCGFGDLIPWLVGQKMAPHRYIGIEQVEAALRKAQANWMPWVEFVCGDFLDLDLPVADYVLGSGLFFLDHDDWEEYVEKTLCKMLDLARMGVAVNFLSAMTPLPNGENFYADPCHMFRVAKSLTPWVTLRHDYRENDFTLYLYREAR